jgi:hypothetical protein
MGVWVAVGCAIAWAVTFTLFPVLQFLLRTPTRLELRPRRDRSSVWRIGSAWTFRFRWLFLGVPLGLGRWRGALFSAGGSGRCACSPTR